MLGTDTTVRSGAYQRKLKEADPGLAITACAGLGHVALTSLLGLAIAWFGFQIEENVEWFSRLAGALLLAGREIQPSGIPKMMQGIVLVCLIASDFFTRYRIRITRRTEV